MFSASYSYKSSASFSTSTSSTSNGHTTGHAQRTTMHSNPSGTRVETTSQNLGGRPVQETRYFDAQGREVPNGGRSVEGSVREQGRITEIEDGEEGKQ